MIDRQPTALADLPRARPEEIGLDPAALERLVGVMEREIAGGKVPGATIAIARRGKIGFVAALGAQKPGGGAMPLDSIFRIYSMTKPIVTVAAMMLVEEGRLFLADPVSQYIPAFAETKVGVERGDELDFVAPKRPMMVQDLMRHTSGLTYGFTGVSLVQQRLAKSGALSQEKTAAERMETIAALPLMHQPGEVWEYSVSTDVLGRIVEVIEGAPLGAMLAARIFKPLGMVDTAFFTPPEKLGRRADPFSFAMLDAIGVDPNNMTAPPKFEMGGGGLLGTLADYARFLAMLDGGGALRGKRIFGAAHGRLHDERSSGAACGQGPSAAAARLRLRPRFWRARRSGPGAYAGRRRRILLGRRRRHDVLRFAARRVVRDPDAAGAGISRLFPHAVPHAGLCGGGLAELSPQVCKVNRGSLT
jgi:CubicO group peptidase (beta-lactamase class C family)